MSYTALYFYCLHIVVLSCMMIWTCLSCPDTFDIYSFTACIVISSNHMLKWCRLLPRKLLSIWCRDRNEACGWNKSQTPTFTAHTQRTHTDPREHENKKRGGNKKRKCSKTWHASQGQLLWFRLHIVRKDRPNTPQECLNSNRLERKTSSTRAAYLVSTSKCYAEVHPCQKKRQTGWKQ